MGETLRIRAATIVHNKRTYELTSGPIPDDTPDAVVSQLRDAGALETAGDDESAPTLAPDPSGEQVSAFVADATADQVVAAAGEDPSLAAQLLDAEKAGKNRKTATGPLEQIAGQG